MKLTWKTMLNFNTIDFLKRNTTKSMLISSSEIQHYHLNQHINFIQISQSAPKTTFNTNFERNHPFFRIVTAFGVCVHTRAREPVGSRTRKPHHRAPAVEGENYIFMRHSKEPPGARGATSQLKVRELRRGGPGRGRRRAWAPQEPRRPFSVEAFLQHDSSVCCWWWGGRFAGFREFSFFVVARSVRLDRCEIQRCVFDSKCFFDLYYFCTL